MTFIVVAVRDALNNFMAPECYANNYLAVRTFKGNCNSVDIIKQNPNDFSLWKLAEWNNESGVFSPLSVPEKIIEAKEVID